MPASKHQLAASAYHLKLADLRKLLLSTHKFRDRCLIKTLWWLGVRRNELIKLDVRDLDVERKRVTIHEGKGGKTRVIPIINDDYLSDLLVLIGSRKSGPIFLSNRNRRDVAEVGQLCCGKSWCSGRGHESESASQPSQSPSIPALNRQIFEIETLQCGVDSELSGT